MGMNLWSISLAKKFVWVFLYHFMKKTEQYIFFFLPIQYMNRRNLLKMELMVSIRLIKAHGIFSSTPGSWKFSYMDSVKGILSQIFHFQICTFQKRSA